MGKYFGTDGIRGIANQDLTTDIAYRMGKAAALCLKDEMNKVMVLGTDTRRSCDMLKAALISGITSHGFDVYDLGVMPTPGVAYLTKYYKAACGIVISASHNPAEFNGIKFFGKDGFKLTDENENRMEDFMDLDSVENDHIIGDQIGIIFEKKEADQIYLDFLRKTVKMNISDRKIIVDCANGATSKYAQKLLAKFGAEVITLNCEPDGMNINQNCGSTHPESLQRAVLENQADAGFAFDGDGDRLIAVDEKGEIMDGDHIILSCALFLKEKNLLNHNTVVGTVMTNIGFMKSCQEKDLTVHLTGVGDRYVLEKMREGDFCIGGEQSGHIIFLKDTTTGDGLLSCIKLLEVMSETGQSLHQLNHLMVSYPQILKNVRVSNEFKTKYGLIQEITEKINEIEKYFDGEGRVLIRPSGTEPLIRIMIEGKDPDIMEAKAEELAQIFERHSKGY